MLETAGPISISLPRDLLADIAQMPDDLIDRMHELLEKNTDGLLNSAEKSELSKLVRMAELGQIVSMALEVPSQP
ncbi:MAG: hypothetical protein ABSH22_04060 [Tepidisphaeraceae bacterium]|jgi:hypothetical protein